MAAFATTQVSQRGHGDFVHGALSHPGPESKFPENRLRRIRAICVDHQCRDLGNFEPVVRGLGGYWTVARSPVHTAAEGAVD